MMWPLTLLLAVLANSESHEASPIGAILSRSSTLWSNLPGQLDMFGYGVPLVVFADGSRIERLILKEQVTALYDKLEEAKKKDWYYRRAGIPEWAERNYWPDEEYDDYDHVYLVYRDKNGSIETVFAGLRDSPTQPERYFDSQFFSFDRDAGVIDGVKDEKISEKFLWLFHHYDTILASWTGKKIREWYEYRDDKDEDGELDLQEFYSYTDLGFEQAIMREPDLTAIERLAQAQEKFQDTLDTRRITAEQRAELFKEVGRLFEIAQAAREAPGVYTSTLKYLDSLVDVYEWIDRLKELEHWSYRLYQKEYDDPEWAAYAAEFDISEDDIDGFDTPYEFIEDRLRWFLELEGGEVRSAVSVEMDKAEYLLFRNGNMSADHSRGGDVIRLSFFASSRSENEEDRKFSIEPGQDDRDGAPIWWIENIRTELGSVAAMIREGFVTTEEEKLRSAGQQVLWVMPPPKPSVRAVFRKKLPEMPHTMPRRGLFEHIRKIGILPEHLVARYDEDTKLPPSPKLPPL